jgi:4-aminobutyrate aminotransferase-like enzyme
MNDISPDDMTAPACAPGGVMQSEGDTNLTDRRRAWQARSLDDDTRSLLARDARAFIHQSVSTPCLNAIAKAEGIWIEDVSGRRYMDFHGNNVHHIGYGHPRLKRAIVAQMDALSFAPRRYACETAVLLAEKLAAIAPDILVVGKALGGGILPIAACIARPDLDVAGDWAFGHYTHEKNPVTTRAALTTIEIIEDEDLVANSARVGALALSRMEDMKRRMPAIGDVRGRGLLLGIELVKSRADKLPDSALAEAVLYRALAEAVLYRALDRGLSFKTTMGNVLTLTPPLTTTPAQMTAALDIIEEAIAAG